MRSSRAIRGQQQGHQLDRKAYEGVDDITIDVEANVTDNRHLYKAIMENTMKMMGSLSQQMVEFDNERKDADVVAGRELHGAVNEMHRAVIDSTRKIEGSIAVVEREVLEGQRHIELIQVLEAVHQHAQNGSNHDPILRAIANITETDLSGVMGNLSALGDSHRAFHDSNKDVQGMIDALHQSHGDLHSKHERSHQTVQGLINSLHQSNGDMHSKHDKANQSLQAMINALHMSHGELHSKHEKSSQGLQSLIAGLHDRHGDLHSKHDMLLNAVAGIVMPDLDPLHQHMSVTSEWMADHGGRVRTMEQRMQALEQSANETNGTLNAILNTLQDLSGRSLRVIQEDVQATRATMQKEVGDLRGVVGELRAHLQSHRGEVNDLIKKHSDKSLAFLDSHGTIVRELHGSFTQALNDHTGLLDSKFGKHSSDLFDALNSFPDHNQVSAALSDICREHTDHISRKHADIFQALNDHASSVQFNFDQHGRNMADVLGGFQGDLSGLAQSHGHLHSALGNIPTAHDHDATADAVHRRLEAMLTGIPDMHDHDQTADAVHRRMEESLAKLGDHSHILSAIDGMDLTSHEKRVLEAIDVMQEASMTTILEAIQSINMNVSVNGLDCAKIDAAEKVAAAIAAAQSKRSVSPAPVTSLPQTTSTYRVAESRQAWTPSVSNSPGVSSFGGASPARTGFSSTATTITRAATPPRRMVPEVGSGGYSPMKTAMPIAPNKVQTPRKGYSNFSAPSPLEKECYTCLCGFTCGTEAAMQKHLDRFKGQPGHGLI